MSGDLADLYQEVILDHSRRPRHGKRLTCFDASAKGNNPLCGDKVQVFVKRAPDGAIADIGFEARGCAISVASADMMADVVRGMSAAQVKEVASRFRDLARTGHAENPDDEALEALQPFAGVHSYPSRVKCATLAWHALLAALDGKQEAGSE
ncbi:MAG: Fe-S cluster assembly sulfur transfer protein SufU [Acetobacteraceae bacterium]